LTVAARGERPPHTWEGAAIGRTVRLETSPTLEGLTMTLSVGQRVTLLKIDECLAMTHRYEMEIRKALEPEAVGYEKRNTRMAVIRQRGKRKEFFLDLASDDILLDGWDLPIRPDTECNGVWAGNACYNLVGEPEAIRQVIETKAAAPISDNAKAKIIVARGERRSATMTAWSCSTRNSTLITQLSTE